MILGDYHTHTVYSHGKGSVEDNVAAAVAKGLKEIAITDHSFSHMFYNVHRADFSQFIIDIENARVRFPTIKILSGLETNLLSYDGQVDMSKRVREKLDVAICGYHKLAGSGFDFFSFTLPKLFSSSKKAKAIVKNTDAYINAIMQNDIDFISHPNVGMPIDVLELGKVASEQGVLIELNGKRMALTDDEILSLCDMGCQFICNSDAHSPNKVGECKYPLEVVERLGVQEYVANYNKLPTFRGIRKDED